MKEHTLFPEIPERVIYRHKDPFEIFLEAHKEKDWDQTAFEWTFSNEDEKICEELKFRSIHNTEIFSEYLLNLNKTYRGLLNGDIKSAGNAIALMRGFMWGCKSGIISFFGCCPTEEAEKEAAYLAEKIDDSFEYFVKLATDADTTPQPPEQSEAAVPNFVLTIAGYYPLFIQHYPILKEAGYIQPNNIGLKWLKSKQSLAEYFVAIKPESKGHEWKVLENIFNKKDLRQAASQNGNPFKGKNSKDFCELEAIITLP